MSLSVVTLESVFYVLGAFSFKFFYPTQIHSGRWLRFSNLSTLLAGEEVHGGGEEHRSGDLLSLGEWFREQQPWPQAL